VKRRRQRLPRPLKAFGISERLPSQLEHRVSSRSSFMLRQWMQNQAPAESVFPSWAGAPSPASYRAELTERQISNTVLEVSSTECALR
jgi:hypothetical protein